MLTINNNYVAKNNIVNKGFIILDALFTENGWNIIINEPNWIVYTKFGHETECFEIKIDKLSVSVSIPLKNIPFQYVSTFTDYFQASEYTEARFKEFIALNQVSILT